MGDGPGGSGAGEGRSGWAGVVLEKSVCGPGGDGPGGGQNFAFFFVPLPTLFLFCFSTIYDVFRGIAVVFARYNTHWGWGGGSGGGRSGGGAQKNDPQDHLMTAPTPQSTIHKSWRSGNLHHPGWRATRVGPGQHPQYTRAPKVGSGCG